MKNKKIICTLFCLFSFLLLAQNARAIERIYAKKMIEYLNVPDDVIIYYGKSINSEVQPKLPEIWEDVVGNLVKAKDGSTWYDLFLIDGAYVAKYYQHYGGQAYISTDNVELYPDKALHGLYEGKYLGAYYFEGKNRIVLFSQSKESEGKTIHAYAFDNVDGIGSYDGLDTRNLKLAFHQENYIENCSDALVRQYLNKTFMADSNENGIDEIWYNFPNSCNNPYEPDRFDVIMQENEMNFHAIKVRKSAGPAHEESAFEAIESNMQNIKPKKLAKSVLTWLVNDVMTEEMYVAKTKIELLGKWLLTSQMIDDEFTLPKNEQIEIEFLANGTLLYNNPKNKDFPRGKHSYTWHFNEANERGVFIKIADEEHGFSFNESEANILVSKLSSYFMFKKIKK